MVLWLTTRVRRGSACPSEEVILSQNTQNGRAHGRGPTVGWWTLGLVLVVLVAAALAAYFARLTAGLGPQAVVVTEINHAHGLAVDPWNPQILWVGSHAGLIRVANGQRWVRIGRQRYDMMGFTVSPAQPNVLLTSGHPGPGDRRPDPLGVEISRDGGQTWRRLSLAGEADFHALTINPSDPRVLYAWNVFGRTGLYRSRDGGRRWDFLGASGLGDVFYLAAHPRSADVVVAGTSRGLYLSKDAGQTWRPVTPVLAGMQVTAVEVHPKTPQVMYAYAARPGLGLVRSKDGGRQWTAVGVFLGDGDAVSNLALDPSDPEILYFATYGGDLFRSTDGGKTRQRWVSRGKVVAP